MIIFDLICEHQHRFEGWFHSADDFTSQHEGGLVHCPQCDSPNVRKLPSAVAISKHRGEEPPPASSAVPPAQPAAALPMGNTQAMAIFRQLTKAMIAISEDVGTSFAEEARRMHYEEIPERPIRGQTTDDEFSELEDEGITVFRMPNIKEEDLN